MGDNMNFNDKNGIIIYINIFVHYPETYNAYTITNKFNSYFKDVFPNDKFNDKDCYVMLNSAPHTEEESLKIEVSLVKSLAELLNIEMFVLNCKEFVVDYFNNRIKDIDIEFVNDKY